MPCPQYQSPIYRQRNIRRLNENQNIEASISRARCLQWRVLPTAHNLIVGNLFFALRPALKGKTCRTYTSNMRVRVAATGLYTYPDLVLVCGERIFDDSEKETLLNPTLVIEVLSPSAEAYD